MIRALPIALLTALPLLATTAAAQNYAMLVLNCHAQIFCGDTGCTPANPALIVSTTDDHTILTVRGVLNLPPIVIDFEGAETVADGDDMLLYNGRGMPDFNVHWTQGEMLGSSLTVSSDADTKAAFLCQGVERSQVQS